MAGNSQNVASHFSVGRNTMGRVARAVARLHSGRFVTGALVCVLLLGTAIVFVGNRARLLDSPIEDDEMVVFFPTFAYLTADGTNWVIQTHGWIYEPEDDSRLRAASLDGLRRLLGLEKHEAETAVFKERARAFLVDNERGKAISIGLGDRRYAAGVSRPNGHFQATVRVSARDVRELQRVRDSDDGWLRFEAVTRKGDARVFPGRVLLIDQTGLSVISDIDDTIKISEVADREALLRNTFLRRFEPVPGMAKLYQSWAEAGARFHYVSASPWQLYEPLSVFLRTAGFPAGTFHLKYFRCKDSTAVELFASPETLKRDTITSILSAFPRRKFMLVGDSGEKDPEIYGALAREHPEQVVRILIRDVTGDSADSARYQSAFDRVGRDRWLLFRRAGELDLRPP